MDVPFEEGLSYDLPYPDASFDRVVSSLFFHHLVLADKERTIAEIVRVLRPGGELHVADWGQPRSLPARAGAVAIRRFDGDEPTRDNLAGRLPELFEAGGLEDRHEPQAGERTGAEELLPPRPDSGHADRRDPARGRFDDGQVFLRSCCHS